MPIEVACDRFVWSAESGKGSAARRISLCALALASSLGCDDQAGNEPAAPCTEIAEDCARLVMLRE